MPNIDMDMLANDIADAIDKGDHPIAVDARDILPHLAAFIEAITGDPVGECRIDSTPKTAAIATERIQSLLTYWKLPQCGAITVPSNEGGKPVWRTVLKPIGDFATGARAAALARVYDFLCGRTEFFSVELGTHFVTVKQRA